MANFLRDQRIANLMVNNSVLTQIDEVFKTKMTTINNFKEINKKSILSYIVRYDGKGCRVFTIDDVLKFFEQGKNIERIIFTLETEESIRTNRAIGTCMELRLDQTEENNCFYMVTADDRDWVDAAFASIQDVLFKYKTRHAWVRNSGTGLSVQIIGILLGFVLSLIGAVKFSPFVRLENSFLICFIFILVVFSNIWPYLNKTIFSILSKYYPNLEFRRSTKDKFNWLYQTIIGGTVASIFLAALFGLTSYVGHIIAGFVNP